jgi:hypothetical protein
MDDEELYAKLREGLEDLEANGIMGLRPKPDKYYPDGKPILSDELMPATMKWALLFETQGGERIVGQTTTPYGERLSTVWLGLDHNFSRTGPPLIFETMLFAPRDKEAQREYLKSFVGKGPSPEKEAAYDRDQKFIEKHFPHDQLQLRYATRREAEDSHEKLKLQCLIPPRWRHFLLGTVMGDSTWKHYDEEDDECWT